MKKLLNRCLLLLTLCLGAGVARAQTPCVSANPPVCTFLAVDVFTGLSVDALCVGRAVRFEQCPGRNIPNNLLFYGLLPGAGTTFASAGCSPPNQYPFVFTPRLSDVGTVTVSELANVGALGTYYIRTFQVYATPPPTFTVVPCPGGSALVTITDPTPYDSYTVTGRTQPLVRNQPTVVVLPAGATAITVTGHYAANGLCEGSASQPIALPPPQVPLFTTLTLDGPLPGGAATLAVGQLPAGYRYRLQLAEASAPGGFRDVASVPPGSTSVALPSPAAGCYRIFRNDFCDGSPAATPLICTLSLTGNSAQNRNQLLLSDAGSPGTTYAVTRDGAPLAAFTAVAGGLEDAAVACGTTYTYRVTATQPGGGTAVSNPVTILTRSNLPPARPGLLASFNLNNVVELTPLLTPAPALPRGSTLHYRRAAGGAAPVDFGTATNTRPQRDSTALAELRAQPPCYTVSVVDVCQNTSAESATACPALLAAAPADPDGSAAALSWTAFTGPDPSVPATYLLQRLGPDGAVLSALAVSGGSAPDLTPPPDRQVLRYRLRIGGAGLPPSIFSYSNVASVTRQLALTMPTAFTPNGDGLNDVLEVKGRYLRNYTFVVVDRNGQQVFRGTQRSEAWDGRIRGQAPVPGAYVWRFQQAGEDGQPFTATGSITLLK